MTIKFEKPEDGRLIVKISAETEEDVQDLSQVEIGQTVTVQATVRRKDPMVSVQSEVYLLVDLSSVAPPEDN